MKRPSKKVKVFRRRSLSAAIIQSLLALPPLAGAAEIIVDTDVDGAAGGACTLRDAVESANTDLATGGCPAGDGFDTIRIDLPDTATITLTQGQLLISTSMRIFGASTFGESGRPMTISGGGSARIFDIDDGLPGVGPDVFIEGLTLASGSASGSGGAIRNEEFLRLDRVHVKDSVAGGAGGGVANGSGILDVRNSTFSANSASLDGGGISVASAGEALLVNVTISGNTAIDSGGGLSGVGAELVVEHSTIVGNSGTTIGAGLYALQSTLTIRSSIIANNAGTVNCFIFDSSVLNVGGNLIDGFASGCGVSASNADPMLDPLADNGGPTPTHRPALASPAIDLATGNCAVTDQRGAPRDLSSCDAGAVERSSTSIVVDSLADSVSIDGECTLREALISSNRPVFNDTPTGECVAGFDGPTISFDPSIHGGTITLTGSELTIGAGASGIAIAGPEAGITIDADAVNAGGDRRALAFSNTTATLSRVNLTGGSAYYGGAMVSDASEVTLDRSTIMDNSGGKGAIWFDNGGKLSIINSTLSGNSGNFGGAISGRRQSLVIQNSTIVGNTAGGYAAGIATFIDSDVTLSGSVIAGNMGGAGDCFFDGIALAADDTNLIGDGSCATNALAGDPLLGPLQDNGGSGSTRAPGSGSPLIDAAGTTCSALGVDQTGMPRPIDGNGDGTADCDIGAVEFVDIFPPQAEVTTLSDFAAGDETLTVTVRYEDGDSPMFRPSVDRGDLEITGPAGAAAPGPLPVVQVIPRNAFTLREALADYVIGAPGGSWDSTDNGEWTITVRANEVFDEAVPLPNGIPRRVLDTFTVDIVDPAEIAVSGNGVAIDDGDTTPDTADLTSFGSVKVATDRTRTFTITNEGGTPLNLPSDVTIAGSDRFSVASQPAATILAPGAITTFDVRFSSGTEGTFDATINIPNDDPDESPFDFAIQARAAVNVVAPVITDASFSLPETAEAGDAVGTVTATDDDGDIAGFAIVAGDPNGNFLIASDGRIDVASAAGLTPGQSFSLTVEVRDAGGLTDQGTVTITITNVDRAPTIEAAVFTITESAMIGAFVGQLVADDADDDLPATGAFAITEGNAGGAFTVSDSGVLTVADPVALEVGAVILTVSVTDETDLSATASITVEVQPVPEETLFSNGFEEER